MKTETKSERVTRLYLDEHDLEKMVLDRLLQQTGLQKSVATTIDVRFSIVEEGSPPYRTHKARCSVVATTNLDMMDKRTPPSFDIGDGRITVGDSAVYGLDRVLVQVTDITQDGEATIEFPDGRVKTVKWRMLLPYKVEK